MKIKFNMSQLGVILALLLIAYISVSAMLWEYVRENTTIVSVVMLFIAILAVFTLIYKPIKKQSIEISFFLYYLYFIFACLVNGYISIFIKEPTLLITPMFWMFIALLFKDAARRKMLSMEIIIKIFFVLTVVCFALFCFYFLTNQSAKYSLSGLNVVYYLLFMLPVLLSSKDKKIVVIGIVLNLLAVLMSGKRTALISIVVALVVWRQFDVNYRSSKEKLFKMFLFVVLGIAAVYGAVKIAERMDLNILERMESLFTGDDSDGSGRTKIWESYFEYMKADNPLTNLIGRGYSATRRNSSLRGLGMTWAHNDFLQVLFDYGILGLTIFCSIIVKLFMIARKMKRVQYCYYAPFLASLIIFVICCFVSMVTLQPQWFLAMAAFWGSVIGDFEQKGLENT